MKETCQAWVAFARKVIVCDKNRDHTGNHENELNDVTWNQ